MAKRDYTSRTAAPFWKSAGNWKRSPINFDYPFVFITIGIVDARSGEVLAFTKPVSPTKVLKNPKALNKMIMNSLKKMPAAADVKQTVSLR
jgi:hypothetical protein